MGFARSVYRLYKKGLRYWLSVGILTGVGTYVGDHIGKGDMWVTWRYKIYSYHLYLDPKAQSYANTETVLVLIKDEDYWKGKLAGRVPLKRDYLGCLVQALDTLAPAVIALDFDFRSPTPDKKLANYLVNHEDYRKETESFFDALESVAERRRIILPRTIEYVPEKRDYIEELDIFTERESLSRKVAFGYIALPYDLRKIPLSLLLNKSNPIVQITSNPNEGVIKSFAQAIVDAYGTKSSSHSANDSLPFGSYIPSTSFTTFTPREIFDAANGMLRPNELKGEKEKKIRKSIEGKIVIVGGQWHNMAYGRGSLIDEYFTPEGNIPGAYVHANYVEALRSGRVYKPWPKWAAVGAEVLLTLLVAVIFALGIEGWYKVAVLLLVGFVLVFLSYFSWQNLGWFFDFFVPALAVIGHAVYEQIREWQKDAQKFRALKKQSHSPLR